MCWEIVHKMQFFVTNWKKQVVLRYKVLDEEKIMEDKDIVALYWAREEQAIDETKLKYGRYCHSIAYNMLHNREDAEECVNDTYLGAWNSMPPHKPELLPAFLGKITRNLSLKRWRCETADKRGGGELPLVLEELQECVPSGSGVDEEIQVKELAGIIDTFLRGISEVERSVFISRYWYTDSVADICSRFGYGQSKVKMMLSRTRKKLLDKLEKEGIIL